MDQSSCDEGYFIIGWLLLRAIERCGKSQETIEVTISHDQMERANSNVHHGAGEAVMASRIVFICHLIPCLVSSFPLLFILSTVELLLNSKSESMVEVNAKNSKNLTAMDQSSCDEGYFIIGWLLLRAIERCGKSQETIEVKISHDQMERAN
ncbi:hypothetical protein Syun_018690 [Stephania yunnanensis]|uniref:Uncharacterized protein n=1 Tax=Stephania yunnanensis TaxID=152371 RepID=A0AAP0NW23_9MAGN